MHPVLKRLGVSPEVQSFFHADELRFDYGNVCEIYEEGLHYVPTTPNLWVAGNRYATEIVLCQSAMEALAWYSVNQYIYNAPAALAFVSLGNLPTQAQLNWVARHFRRRKLTLAFGNSLLGALTDIRVAGWLKEKNVVLGWQKENVEIRLNGCVAVLPEAQCSLYRFEQLFNLRTGIRTSKPATHATYLAQLHNDAERNPYAQTGA